MNKMIKQQLPIILTVFLIVIMTATAELSGEREILFPEIAAIATGALISPKLAWKTNYIRLFVMICIGSVTGMFIVSYIHIPIGLQMSSAFLIASIIYQFSGTTFAPVISSVVLPVMLQTNSIVYPIAAAVLTLLILMMRWLIQMAGIKEKVEFVPEQMPDKKKMTDMFIGWGVGSIVIIAAVYSGVKFAAAPPLLVAFTEFRKPGSPVQKKAVKLASLIIGCAFIGTALRYIFSMMNSYLFVAAGITILIVCITMKKTGMFVPPAAALSVLAFLIPEKAVITYPLQIAAGTIILVAASLILANKSYN